MELLKLLDTSQIVAQMISFAILFFVLRILVWKRFLKALDDRRDRIAAELKAAEDEKAACGRLKNEYDSRMETIDRAARFKIEEAVSEGKRIAEQIRANANKEALEIMAKADEDIESQLSRAREELKEEIVDLAILAANRVVEEKLTPDGDRKIVEDFLNRIEKIK